MRNLALVLVFHSPCWLWILSLSIPLRVEKTHPDCIAPINARGKPLDVFYVFALTCSRCIIYALYVCVCLLFLSVCNAPINNSNFSSPTVGVAPLLVDVCLLLVCASRHINNDTRQYFSTIHDTFYRILLSCFICLHLTYTHICLLNVHMLNLYMYIYTYIHSYTQSFGSFALNVCWIALHWSSSCLLELFI